jgi:hypothetical protein
MLWGRLFSAPYGALLLKLYPFLKNFARASFAFTLHQSPPFIMANGACIIALEKNCGAAPVGAAPPFIN